MTRVRKQLNVHRPLNYMDYDKEAARRELTEVYGWRDYGGKHSESRFTKFYQETYLPRKFGFDKRRLHLSSLIVAGQTTREAALAELEEPIAPPDQLRRDVRFVAKKLGLTPTQLESYIDAAPVDHDAYPNGMLLHRTLTHAKNVVRRVAGPRAAA
jgi:hypothetical protein